MAHCFNNFFRQEKLDVHYGFPSSTLSQGMSLIDESCMSMMDTFEPFTESDIRQLLKRSSSVFFADDTTPIWLVKVSECSDKSNYKES